MFFIRGCSEGHAAFLGGAVKRGAKIRLLFSRFRKGDFDGAELVEFLQIAEDLRHNLGVLAGTTVNRFGQRNKWEMTGCCLPLLVFHLTCFFPTVKALSMQMSIFAYRTDPVSIGSYLFDPFRQNPFMLLYGSYEVPLQLILTNPLSLLDNGGCYWVLMWLSKTPAV
jgi:hypothetical protein